MFFDENTNIQLIVGKNGSGKSTLMDLMYGAINNFSYMFERGIYSNYSGKTKEYDFKSRETIDSKTRRYWINSIFYKNDGYTTPIVLNPYRYDGFINCQNELELSKDRLATLFIYSKQENKKLFDPYSFYNMTLRLKKDCLTKKYNLIYSRFNKKNPDHKAEKDDDVLYLLDDKIINILKQQFNFLNSGSYLKKIGMCYLILKIIDITLKYSNYVYYADAIYFNSIELIIKNNTLFDELLNKIKKDNTHITKKFDVWLISYNLMIPNLIANIHFYGMIILLKYLSFIKNLVCLRVIKT